MVDLLVEHKADLEKSAEDDSTPLYAYYIPCSN